jgi:hypothetical protein
MFEVCTCGVAGHAINRARESDSTTETISIMRANHHEPRET